MVTSRISPPEAAPSLNLGQLYSLVLRRSWLIGLCFVAAVSAALAYVLIATPIYESTAILEIQKVQQRVYNPADQSANGQDTGDDTELKTIEQALQLDGLFGKVVTAPAVVADKNFLPGLGFKPDDTPTTAASPAASKSTSPSSSSAARVSSWYPSGIPTPPPRSCFAPLWSAPSSPSTAARTSTRPRRR